MPEKAKLSATRIGYRRGMRIALDLKEVKEVLGRSDPVILKSHYRLLTSPQVHPGTLSHEGKLKDAPAYFTLDKAGTHWVTLHAEAEDEGVVYNFRSQDFRVR